MYHIVSSSKRKCKRCDGCSAYNPCTTYEGYCTEVEGLVDRNSTLRKLALNMWIHVKDKRQEGFKMDFTTKNMSLKERYDILNKVDLIPIGTICYEAGDFTEWTKEIVVNEENQKRVTMFWNCLFF